MPFPTKTHRVYPPKPERIYFCSPSATKVRAWPFPSREIAS